MGNREEGESALTSRGQPPTGVPWTKIADTRITASINHWAWSCVVAHCFGLRRGDVRHCGRSAAALASKGPRHRELARQLAEQVVLAELAVKVHREPDVAVPERLLDQLRVQAELDED